MPARISRGLSRKRTARRRGRRRGGRRRRPAPQARRIGSACGSHRFAAGHPACGSRAGKPSDLLDVLDSLDSRTRGGAGRLSQERELRAPERGRTVHSISAVRSYPYYNPGTFQGDAAILVLATPRRRPDRPRDTAPGGLYAAGQAVSYAGWGETVADMPSSTPTQLQSGAASILPNSTCAGAVEFHAGYTLCVAAPNYTPAVCHGDSGGPLVTTTAAGPVEIGITSYGSKTGCGVAPDYFTRVSSVQTWIASAIAGTPAPPPFVPPFNAPPRPAAALSGDGVSATFAAPAADPATMLTNLVVILLAHGIAVATQTLVPTATTAVFPSLQPGTYTVSVMATYSEGSSLPVLSAPVTLAPPRNRKRPSVVARGSSATPLPASTAPGRGQVPRRSGSRGFETASLSAGGRV